MRFQEAEKMLISEIIEKASQIKGGKQKLAQEINTHRNRISDWETGRRKPESAEIALLAEICRYANT